MMRPSRIPIALGLMLVVATTRTLAAQSTTQPIVPAPVERATPFTLDVGGNYQMLDNNYGTWQGTDVRIRYAGGRFSPFASAGVQHRSEGSQSTYGLGTYATLGRGVYSIVGFSVATGGTAVFFPRLRWDATVVAPVPSTRGLLIATGLTHLTFGDNIGGSIVSLGPLWYHGPLVMSGAVHLNHDDVGGANSGSADAGAQYGGEGRYWVGGTLSAGREAYQVLSATPFDVRFTTIGGTVFYQRWLTRRTALFARLEYLDKLTAYHQHGVSLSYHVAF
jgi:YaiO family outer membrane protein